MRDELIGKVQSGELTPREAEDEAARLGLKRIECRPDPDDYDPMRETFWTLPMAVAWIAYRTPEAVREWWDEYRTECWDWHFTEWRLGSDGPVKKGYLLEQRSRGSLVWLRFTGIIDDGTERDPRLTMDVIDAKNSLWTALQEGFFEATGISAEAGKRVPIPAYEWRDLDHIEEGGRDVICARPLGGGPRYEQVVVRSLPITKFWPEKYKNGPQLVLPPTMPPSGSGYMPLYCAAQWIATKGDTQSFDPSDLNVWKPVYAELLAQISSDAIKVIGVRNGEREPVSGFHFAGSPVDYPFADSPTDLLLGDEVYLRSYPYLDETNWSKGFDDSLVCRRDNRWTRLMVAKADVARLWSFDDETPLRSGAQGRPSSMHLIDAEFDRRVVAEEVELTLAAQARALESWLRTTHPKHPKAGRTAIENAIRNKYREHRTTGK